MWNTVVGLVEENGLVVGRVDVAEDGAGGSRAMFYTADSDDDRAAVSILFFAAFCNAADVTGSQDERSTGVMCLDVVVVLLFVPSLRWCVQAHYLG